MIVIGSGWDRIYFNNDPAGSPLKDMLVDGDGDSLLSGGWATDYLFGGRGDDTLDGGGWADFLNGGRGDDVYRFSAHDGGGPGRAVTWIDPRLNVDTIRDAGGYDVIEFDNTIDPSSVTLYTLPTFLYPYQSGRSKIPWAVVQTRDALYVSAAGWSGERLTIRIEGDAAAGRPSRAIEAIVFADGSSIPLDLPPADDPARTPTVVTTPGLFRGTPLADLIVIADGAPNVSVASIDGGDRVVGNDLANHINTAHYFYDSGDDTVEGGGGDDTIEAGVGDNRLHGGDGDDVIEGLGQAWGDAGDDVIRFAGKAWGGDGDDTIVNAGEAWGGAGDDLIVRDSALGPMWAFVGMHGGAGDDTLKGGSRAWGDEGDDSLTGTIGDDFLHGGSGADRLIGLHGADTLDGGGGPGVDYLWGGPGGDLFVIQADDSRTRIGDFDRAEGDSILLAGRTSADLAAATVSIIGQGRQTLLRFDNGGEIVFDNHPDGVAPPEWFQFG